MYVKEIWRYRQWLDTEIWLFIVRLSEFVRSAAYWSTLRRAGRDRGHKTRHSLYNLRGLAVAWWDTLAGIPARASGRLRFSFGALASALASCARHRICRNIGWSWTWFVFLSIWLIRYQQDECPIEAPSGY